VADLSAVCDALAKGQTAAAVPHRNRIDEIGALARSMALF
jgi:HAMP domain-containing protein